MKVLMVHSFHHARGGDSTYALGLSSALHDAGHTVIPLAMRHPDNIPSVWAQHFVSWVDHRAPTGALGRFRSVLRSIWSKEAMKACQTLIEQTQPDVVHLHHVHRHLTPSVLDPIRQAGIPVVWTVHDYELICPQGHLFVNGQHCERCRGHRYNQAIIHRCKWGQVLPSALAALEKSTHQQKQVWNNVDRFLCPSRYLADALIRFGLAPDRVVHQPNFLSCGPIPSTPTDEKGWLVAGRLTVEKGVMTALEAARALPEHPLILCGSGPLEDTVRAANLPNVVTMGHLPNEALSQAIEKAAVVAVPSVWAENFPYAVLEAQAAGKPVVASRTGGIPEQIEDGVDGVLVPPGDPLALAEAVGSLLADPKRRRAIGERAAERVRQNLSVDTHLKQIIGHYTELCDTLNTR